MPAERIHGQSKFTLKRMGALAIIGIVGYSTRPLYLARVVGLVSIMMACAYLCYVIVVAYLGGTVSVGRPTTISTIPGLGGIQSSRWKPITPLLHAPYRGKRMQEMKTSAATMMKFMGMPILRKSENL